jgi:hypothetical protein
MYMGPNKVSMIRARSRASVPSGVGDIAGLFSKVRKALHKLSPKELSPTRMLEDSQKKKAKTAADKIAASEAQRAAANEEAAAATAAQIAAMQSVFPNAAGSGFQAPGVTQPFALTEYGSAGMNPVPQFNPGAPTASAAPAPDNTVLYVGAGALGLLGVYLLLGRKKR